jgi:type I restriction enzyme S subunit
LALIKSVEPIYGDLPDSWQMITLGSLIADGHAELQTGPFGTTLHASAYRPTGTPVVAVLHLGDNRLRHVNLPRVDDETKERLRRYLLRENDIIFGRKGAVDRRALVCAEEEGWLQGSDCIRLRLNANVISPQFVSFVLGSGAYIEWIERHAGGATMPSLNQEILRLVPLPVPPLPEQRAIARILGALDDKIELNRRMNHTLEEMAQAIFKSWYVDFDPVIAKSEGRQSYGMNAETAALFPSAFQDSELGPIPKEWHVAKLGDVCKLAYGKSLTANNRSPGNVAVFGSDGQIGWHDAALVKGPGIVIGRKGNAGKVNWSQGDFFPIDTTFYVQLRMENLPLNYLFYALQLLDLPNVSGDSAVPGLNREMAYSLDTLIPAQSVLEVFERLLSPLRSRIDANEQESRTLAAIHDALLPKLLSGEIRVKPLESKLAQPPVG